MSDQLRLGILGVGYAGATMLEAAAAHPAVTVTAVAEPDADVRQLLVRGVGRAYPDSASLWADDDVDAVYIATPTPMHADHATAALKAGKHVILEKPMGIDLAEARRIRSAAATSRRALVVGHSQSYEPYARQIRASAQRHDFGGVLRLLIQEENDWMSRPRRPDELDEARGGGVVLRQGAHLIDVARYLTDGAPVLNVNAVGVASHPGGPCGSFIADLEFGTTAGKPATCTIAYNGWATESSSEDVSAPAAGDGELGRKGRRNRRLVEAALRGELLIDAPAPTHPENVNRRRIHAVYERGQVTVHGTVVTTLGQSAQVTRVVKSARWALLDELLAAVRGDTIVHDGDWGIENLRVSLEVAHSAKHGTTYLHQTPIEL